MSLILIEVGRKNILLLFIFMKNLSDWRLEELANVFCYYLQK